ncbi:MAG: RNA methyltransferase [Bacteroidales bacterium]|jgi:tRNA G18 (ribose-2'-O)-methylase SpoU|nr:RNA methyltransferase [Bacteroidales bacterium]MCU0407434.1 RNA methyltransferase [Bacteroidales bacterium]
MRKLLNSELERKTVKEFRNSAKMPFTVVLDNVRSQQNVGSVFRTADAFLVRSLYLCGITASPPSRDIEKTALGATGSVDWKYFGSTVEAVMELKDKGCRIIAVEQAEGSVILSDFRPESGRSYGLIFGHEIKGVSQEVLDLCDGCIEIPQFGTKHSFNIAVSAGIVLWELSRQLHD